MPRPAASQHASADAAILQRATQQLTRLAIAGNLGAFAGGWEQDNDLAAAFDASHLLLSRDQGLVAALLAAATCGMQLIAGQDLMPTAAAHPSATSRNTSTEQQQLVAAIKVLCKLCLCTGMVLETASDAPQRVFERVSRVVLRAGAHCTTWQQGRLGVLA